MPNKNEESLVERTEKAIRGLKEFYEQDELLHFYDAFKPDYKKLCYGYLFLREQTVYNYFITEERLNIYKYIVDFERFYNEKEK